MRIHIHIISFLWYFSLIIGFTFHRKSLWRFESPWYLSIFLHLTIKRTASHLRMGLTRGKSSEQPKQSIACQVKKIEIGTRQKCVINTKWHIHLWIFMRCNNVTYWFDICHQCSLDDIGNWTCWSRQCRNLGSGKDLRHTRWYLWEHRVNDC